MERNTVTMQSCYMYMYMDTLSLLYFHDQTATAINYFITQFSAATIRGQRSLNGAAIFTTTNSINIGKSQFSTK